MDRFKSNCNLLPSTSALLLGTQLTLQLFILLLVSAMLISILVLGIKLIAYLQSTHNSLLSPDLSYLPDHMFLID